MRTDFENLKDGERARLHPLPTNPLHKKPVEALFTSGYFYAFTSDPAEGPDYYMGDVATFCGGFDLIPPTDD